MSGNGDSPLRGSSITVIKIIRIGRGPIAPCSSDAGRRCVESQGELL